MGGIGAGKNYTLYDVGIDNNQFVQAGYKTELFHVFLIYQEIFIRK